MKIKLTKSLCPECLTIIDASIFEENGRVMIEKTCNIHGYYKDIYWSNIEHYKRFAKYIHNGPGIENPNINKKNKLDCPFACGLCSSHSTTTILANIDVTNRCNQNCPICFANASSSGYVYEPSLEQIKTMMQILLNQRPVPCPAIQFSGGEPTMRNDIVQIVQMARELKFVQIQMATNGIKLAKDLQICKDLNMAGLHTVYLQFDGVTPEPYIINRGYNALPIKLKCIENCRTSGLNSVSLVPTLAKGVNDMQVGDIIKFAGDNSDTVKGINFQPISFTGRINTEGTNNVSAEERMEKRITIPDLLYLMEEQTNGDIIAEDFYPVPFIVPISHFLEEEGIPNVEFTVHPNCGTGTYVYIENGKMIPITRFIDVEGLFERIGELVPDNDRFVGKIKRLKKLGLLVSELHRYIDTAKAPKSVDVKTLFINVLRDGTGDAIKEFHSHTLFIGAMHFMDLYNMDLERIQRCGVHYTLPDGRIIPFCTYNTIHRVNVEKMFIENMFDV
jgi:uncharacterized radical SAM superfamily Fe-S cluster-containing enzyme